MDELHDAEYTRVERMELVMNEDDILYLKDTAPPLADGYDFRGWVDDVFSR